MSILGRKASQVVKAILHDLLHDPTEATWSGMAVERFVNDAVLELAEDAECFRRIEIIVPTAAKAEYPLSGEVRKIVRVRYDNERLEAASADQLDAEAAGWRSEAGTPLCWTGERRVRLYPVPTSNGTALTWSGSAPITAAEGHTLTGHDYCLGQDTGADRFFRSGDGTCTNEAAADNLLVEYAYYPAEVTGDTVIPHRFIGAIQHLAAYKALLTATDEAKRALAPAMRELYQKHAARLVTAGKVDATYEWRHWEAMQAILASGQPIPAHLAEDYERLAGKYGDKDGDPAGLGVAVPLSVLTDQVAQAITQGRSVPPEVLDQFRRATHDLAPWSEQLQATLSWADMRRFVTQAVVDGKPLTPAFVHAYLERAAVEMAAPTARDLETEAYW